MQVANETNRLWRTTALWGAFTSLTGGIAFVVFPILGINSRSLTLDRAVRDFENLESLWQSILLFAVIVPFLTLMVFFSHLLHVIVPPTRPITRQVCQSIIGGGFALAIFYMFVTRILLFNAVEPDHQDMLLLILVVSNQALLFLTLLFATIMIANMYINQSLPRWLCHLSVILITPAWLGLFLLREGEAMFFMPFVILGAGSVWTIILSAYLWISTQSRPISQT